MLNLKLNMAERLITIITVWSFETHNNTYENKRFDYLI